MTVRKFVAVLLLTCFFNFLFGQHQRADSVVAIVNDEIITYGELYSKIKDGIKGIESSNLPTAQKEAQKQLLIKRALQSMIDDKLTRQEAKRYNIKISEETIREQVEKELKEKGKPIEDGEIDLTEIVRSRLTIQKLFHKKSGYSQQEKRRAIIDTFVSPEEISTYYKKHIKDFSKKSKIKTRIITLFYSKNGGRDQTLKKAKSIVKELKEGASFEELAKLYSNDPYGKEGGTWPRIEKGEEAVWDYFSKGEALYEEVEDIAFSMKKGEISDPIPVDSQHYCQIIKIEDLKQGGVRPFAEVQNQIRVKIRYIKILKALDRMRYRLRKKSFIWPADIFQG